MFTTDHVEARARDVLPGLLANEVADLQDATPDQLRRALALHLIAKRLPIGIFDDLPADLSQQPSPDDLGDTIGLLGIVSDTILGDGACDCTRDIIGVLVSNQRARLRARALWAAHCHFEALEALTGGAR